MRRSMSGGYMPLTLEKLEKISNQLDTLIKITCIPEEYRTSPETSPYKTAHNEVNLKPNDTDSIISDSVGNNNKDNNNKDYRIISRESEYAKQESDIEKWNVSANPVPDGTKELNS